MLEQTLVVIGIALVDSINPSALLVTLFLLTQSAYTSKVLTYISAIFVTYFLLGIALMLGLKPVFDALGSSLQNPVAYAIQGILGLILFIVAWIPAKAESKPSSELVKAQYPKALFMLGITVTLIEFSTALPYLGAISILTTQNWAVAQWLPILFLYNLIFVLPPLMLLFASRAMGNRIQPRLERWGAWLRREARETLMWILGIVGFLLILESLVFFDFFGLIPELGSQS